MKKVLFACLLALCLSVSVCAAETVIYQNDFSSAESINDFTSYRSDWEIRDGALYMVDDAEADQSSFGHIIYTASELGKSYVIDVDVMYATENSGVVFSVDAGGVTDKTYGFAGYFVYVSEEMRAALGAAHINGAWVGDLYKASVSRHLYEAADLHFNIAVKEDRMALKVYNLLNNRLVMNTTYSIGGSSIDPVYSGGTFGFRMQASAAGKTRFDNLVITTAYETQPKSIDLDAHIDAINEAPLATVYKNSFDGESDLASLDLYGDWAVKDGRLFLLNTDGEEAFVVFNGDSLAKMENYVLDVDIYNLITEAGAFVRGDYDSISNGGYYGYTFSVGSKASLILGGKEGKDGGYLNRAFSPTNILKGATDVHLRLAVMGRAVQATVTDVLGNILWTTSQYSDTFDKGVFGLRLSTEPLQDTKGGVNFTSFDNLTVQAYPSVEETVIKMTVDSPTATVNGEHRNLDAAPVIRNSRTMLPVRFVAENLGATVAWNEATKTIIISAPDVIIEITIGAASLKVNGREILLDSPAYIDVSNSRTYLPVRAVAENLGAFVTWDDSTKTATLTK